MSYGYYGSTLVDELNRLANGGTYPPRQNYLDTAGAAQAWAAARSVTLTDNVTDTVGVINEIYGYTDPGIWLDIAGICNLLAGTTGLEPAAALREIAN